MALANVIRMRVVGRIPHTRFGIRQRLINICTALLTQPRRSYHQRVPNNLEALKRSLRKCDVVLVEGDQRVSQVICYLTQSSWSHVAIYVGDELLKREPERAAELSAAFGEEAKHLLIEAVDEGVVPVPLSKYNRFNLRLCRPHGLRKEDVPVVLDEIVARLGHRYDITHIFDLARHFFPITLVPERWRRADGTFGKNSDSEVICSCMIAKAFARVGYPILPQGTVESVEERATWLGRMLHRRQRTVARFRELNPALITPRDFDLSPYFEIVKFNHFADPYFSYRDIVWEEPRRPPSSGRAGEQAA
jgi:hypothetical protein